MKLITSDVSNQAINKSQDKYRATIEIRRNEGADARQFEITRVLAEDWVMSDKAFDETCK